MQSHTLKFVMVGDINVGKTQLCKRFTKNTFMHESSSTVGMEFATKEIQFEKSLIKVIYIYIYLSLHIFIYIHIFHCIALHINI